MTSHPRNIPHNTLHQSANPSAGRCCRRQAGRTFALPPLDEEAWLPRDGDALSERKLPPLNHGCERQDVRGVDTEAL